MGDQAAEAARLTPYELRNLAAHLEAAGQEDTLHRLLALETGAGANYWFEAKDGGDPGGYLTDVRRALRLARRAVDARILAGEAAPQVALEIRYTLLIASVRVGLAGSESLLVTMVAKGMLSAEDALVDLSQDGPPGYPSIVALAPHLPEPVRERLLRDALLAAEQQGDRERHDLLSALVRYLPPGLMDRALDVAAGIEPGFLRAKTLAVLAPGLPAELWPRARTVATEIGEPSLRLAALAAFGTPPSRESVRAALSADEDVLARVNAVIVMASTLPPGLLGEALAAARLREQNTAGALIALAPRLPGELLGEAVEIAGAIGDHYRPGGALAALAPRLSGATLRRALRVAGRLGDPAQRILALGELALRLPQPQRDRMLRVALRTAEQAPYRSTDVKNAFVRLVELLPPELLPQALTLARDFRHDHGRAAVLTAVGARLTEPDRTEVLREALRDTRWIDDEELHMLPSETSMPVLARLAQLLPGEVLPFVLDNVSPHGDRDWSMDRLQAIIPHLRADELRRAQRVVRELRDGRAQCTAIAGLVDHVPGPVGSKLLRTALDTVRHTRLNWDKAMALAALAPKLPENLGGLALDIARPIGDEPGARAVAEVAQAVPRWLRRRTIAALPVGYERWRAYAYAALAKKATGYARIRLFRVALAAVGRTDWDDTEAWDATFIKWHVAELPNRLLRTALYHARRAYTRDGLSSSVLAALARRFDGPRRDAILQEALAAAEHINNDAARVRTLSEIGVEVPGVAEAVRRIADPKWRLAGLAAIGEPVPPEAIRAIGFADSDDLDVVLCLLPSLSAEQVRTVLTRLRRSDQWHRHAKGGWLPDGLAEIVHRLAPEIIPDLLEMANDMQSPQRISLLAALTGAVRPLPPRRLAECWRLARPALEDTGRSEVLKALATLAPVVDAIGGPGAVADTASAVHLTARWHP